MSIEFDVFNSRFTQDRGWIPFWYIIFFCNTYLFISNTFVRVQCHFCFYLFNSVSNVLRMNRKEGINSAKYPKHINSKYKWTEIVFRLHKSLWLDIKFQLMLKSSGQCLKVKKGMALLFLIFGRLQQIRQQLTALHIQWATVPSWLSRFCKPWHLAPVVAHSICDIRPGVWASWQGPSTYMRPWKLLPALTTHFWVVITGLLF